MKHDILYPGVKQEAALVPRAFCRANLGAHAFDADTSPGPAYSEGGDRAYSEP